MAVDFTSSFQHTTYTIEQVLGIGGLGIVYLGEHKVMKSPLAIKFLLPEFMAIENIRKKFILEARNMISLNHENIVRVIDLIDQPEFVAIVMEYVPGYSLERIIEEYGALEDEEICEFFPKMLNAVGYIHARGLIHRDLKPSNFMVAADGKVKLCDFGIEKSFLGDNRGHIATETNQIWATSLYMSPEQVKEAQNVSYQTDIFSMGVVLWQMVKGGRPYIEDTMNPLGIQTKIVNEPLERTGTVWDPIIQKATEKEPEERYLDCASMLQDFKSLSQDHTKSALLLENNTGEETTIGLPESIYHEKIDKESTLSTQVIENLKEEVSQSALIDSIEKYKNENKFDFGRLVLFSILLLPFGFILSFIYSYLIWYALAIQSVFIYPIFIVIFGFGGSLGILYPNKLSKCTNLKVAIFSSIIFALVCYYFRWCVWIDLHTNASESIDLGKGWGPISSIPLATSNIFKIIEIFTNPSIFIRFIKETVEDGNLIAASLELLIILFCAAFISYDFYNQPFSFKQKKWYSSSTIKISIIDNVESLIHAIKNGDIPYFIQLSKYEKGNDYSEIEIWHLENEPAYLTIKNFEKKINENGKSKFEETKIIKYA